MCRAARSIRLCTCADDIPADCRWELFPSGGLPIVHAVGLIVEPSRLPLLSASELTRQLLVEKIEGDLNTSDCFDFPYSAEDGDILVLFLGRQVLRFCFREEAEGVRGGFWAESGMSAPRATTAEKRGAIALEEERFRT